MRLAFVTGSLVHGGAERQSIALANRLAERGHDCHLLYVKNDPSQLERLRLPAASVGCLQARRYFDAAALRDLRGRLARLAPAAVLAANPYALLYAGLARAGAPLAATLHSTYLQTAKEQLQMLAYRPLYWSAEAVVFVCEQQRRHWLRRAVFGRRCEVVYNGVDLAYWRADRAAGEARRRALGFAPGDFVVGLSAVLRPEKNAGQLVDALARLRARGIAAKALFIGDGPERDAVQARARAAGVAAHTCITGFQRDVRPYVCACDAMVLTSRTEALSLAALEAMALARPVVHPKVGGAAELIADGEDGYLFPVGDTARLVERLAALAEPARRAPIAEAARRKVERRFSERAMVDRYERLLSEIAAKRRTHEYLRKRAPVRQSR